MRDIYLELMMHGEFLNKKNPSNNLKQKDQFEIAEYFLINEQINQYPLIENSIQNKLISHSVMQSKYKDELRKEIQSFYTDYQLEKGFNLLLQESSNYIDGENYKKITDEISKINYYINKIDYSKPLNSKLSVVLHISETTIETIIKIALANYNEEDYESSLSLFSILACLETDNEMFWYQLGIVASQIQQFNLALQAYNFAIILNPNLWGAKILSIECYINTKQLSLARSELIELKKNITISSLEPIWLELIARLEKVIL
ncbi:MAG: hypothetical protein H0V82_06820 [Candidatus Protochlamydia sp.]|nr:hypothetical protein [Candidatus Protochlamydia sp.]